MHCARPKHVADTGEQPFVTGLHELSASDVHSLHVTMQLVSSCLTFSPLLRLPET